VTGKGFELEIEGKWARRDNKRVSYSFTEKKIKSREHPYELPKHLVKLNTSFPLSGIAFNRIEVSTRGRERPSTEATPAASWSPT